MKHLTIAMALGTLVVSVAATANPGMLYEEQLARAEEGRILTRPIAGIENSRWFDYRSDVLEAQKELSSDIRRATDLEDRRDAWEEYAHELRHERLDYIHDMANRGYRDGTVIIGD